MFRLLDGARLASVKIADLAARQWLDEHYPDRAAKVIATISRIASA